VNEDMWQSCKHAHRVRAATRQTETMGTCPPMCAHRGHSSFVTCVRFNSDDRYLLSSGGHDRCIFQWKTCGVNKEDSANDTVCTCMQCSTLLHHQAAQCQDV
jgi:WD40 repeat protein